MKTTILLVNLGSPDSPYVADVRRYLDEFLMDPRVIDSAWPIRAFVVKLMILPRRPHATAEAYRSIWTEEGSPLITISRRQQELLTGKVDAPVELAMRYGEPSIERVLARITTPHITLVPLYPHYAMSSFETCVEKVKEELRGRAELTVIPPFYDHPMYIDALLEVAGPHLEQPFDHLLFSYHGLPVRHLKKTDPTGAHCQVAPNCCETKSPAHATCYRAQAFKTMRSFVKKAGIPKSKYSIAFQSRLGRDPWLTPFTDQEFVRFAKEGVKRLVVISPSFVADCLETLEELAMRGRESFLDAGGEEFRLVPCLNDHPKWIEALAAITCG